MTQGGLTQGADGPAAPAAAGQRLVDGEFVFRAEDFRRIAAILHDSAGIALSESKATLVYSRLAKRLRSLGLESFRDYCAQVADAHGADERQRLIAVGRHEDRARARATAATAATRGQLGCKDHGDCRAHHRSHLRLLRKGHLSSVRGLLPRLAPGN